MSDQSLRKSLENRLKETDQSLYDHSKRLESLAKQCVSVLNLSKTEKETIIIAALFHDIGILELPNQLIQKTDRLSLDEYEQLQTHVTTGLDLLKGIKNEETIINIIKHHHENMNGFGYPDGLVGEKIPFGSRLIHIIEAFDSMINPRRKNKNGFTSQKAVSELTEFSNRIYDADILKKITPILLEVPNAQNT